MIPMIPQQAIPMGNNQGMMNPEMMSGLTDKVMKDVTKTISANLSQMASEGLHGLVQQGVGIGDATNHIFSELLKMSPVTQGMQAGQSMAKQDDPVVPNQAYMGGSGGPGQPQQQPNGPGGQPPNPNVPAINNQQQAEAPIPASQTNSNENPQVPSLTAPPLSSYQGGFNPMNVLGNVLNAWTGLPIAQTPELQQVRDLHAQKVYGETPSGQVAKVAAVNKLPLSTYERATVQGDVAKNQITALQAESDLNAKAQENITQLLGQYEKLRGPLNRVAGGPSEEMKGLQATLNGLQDKRKLLEKRMMKFRSPNAAAGAAYQPGETRNINNKIYTRKDNGQWIPQTAKS